MVSRNIER